MCMHALKAQPYHRRDVRVQRAALTIAPACRWATGLTFSLPDTLNQLLVPYFTMGRAQLTDSPFAFVDLGGRALTKTSMSSYSTACSAGWTPASQDPSLTAEAHLCG